MSSQNTTSTDTLHFAYQWLQWSNFSQIETAGEGEEKVDGDKEEEPAEVLPPPCIDLQEFKLKVGRRLWGCQPCPTFAQVDHFEGVHAMPDDVEKVEGAPNFRQVVSSLFCLPYYAHTILCFLSFS